MAAATAEAYFTAFLQGLGLPVTQANLNALYGVAQLEGWNDRYNPLNVIQPEPGSSNYNSVGVQSYSDFASGVQGAVTLFSNDHWAGVRQALSRGNDAQSVLDAFKAAYTWDPNVQFPMGDASWGSHLIGAGAATQGNYSTMSETDRLLTGSTTAPTLTADDYKSALGDLASLLTSVPELKGVLDQAVSNHWSFDKFHQEVQQTSWWKANNDSAKQLLALKANDPAEYNTRVTNATSQVQNLAQQMGVTLSASALKSLTQQFMVQGWDNQNLSNQIGLYYTANEDPKALSGQAASLYQQLQTLYSDYGIPLNNTSINGRVRTILDGKTTFDAYKQVAAENAKSLYPSLASQIDSGMTVKQIADPYIQTMSNILELDPNTITVQDPLIKKALQGSVVTTGGKSTATSTTLYDFEKTLRADPRWGYTQNAKDAVSTGLVKIGQDWGFSV